MAVEAAAAAQATAAAAAASTGADANGFSSDGVVRRITSPVRHRRGQKLCRSDSVTVEAEVLATRDVVLSVMTEFLPQQHFSEDADAQSLWSMGLSSVTAVQLVTVLSDRLDVALPPTLLFDYPTVNAVVGEQPCRHRLLTHVNMCTITPKLKAGWNLSTQP